MDNVVSIVEEGPQERTPTGWHQYFKKEMAASEKRLREYTKQGNAVTGRYLDERKNAGTREDGYGGVTSRLNLFWKNINTVSSMLYGNTPKVDVSREHHDPDDDIARVAAVLYERILQTDIEASGEDIPTVLKAALQDRLIPGMGQARVRYEYTSTHEGEDEQGNIIGEVVTDEAAPIDYVNWQDFRWGWGRTWSEIPWLAYRSWLDKEEAIERFGAKVADSLDYKDQLPTGSKKGEEVFEVDQKNNTQKAEIWEFWHKKEKRVFWYSEGASIILDAEDDPLQLEGFWPSPRPMAANLTTTLFIPKADYTFAQDLYVEIDVLQTRIAMITQAIKVVGVYDKGAGDSVGRMLQEAEENQLIPVDNWAMFAEKGGLQGTIQWFPVETVVGVLQVLQGVQQTTIQQLYEITGMSDIMRGGNTDQYTSDGTQQLKAKMGSINIQALQDEFARFASDLNRLKSEVISKHYNPESIAKQGNVMYMPEVDKDKIGPAISLMQSPDVKWRVDIRPESIAMIDYAALKQERAEYLTSIATYLQSATSMAKEVPESLPLLLEFMKFGMVGFKGSNYMEGILDQAIDMAKKAPPKDKDDGQANQQKELMQMQMQMEMQKMQGKHQMDMQAIQAKNQGELQKIQADTQANISEIMAKSKADTQKRMEDLQADIQVIKLKLESDLQRETTQSSMAIAEQDVEHEDNLIEGAAEHEQTMAEIAASGRGSDDNG